MATKPKNIAKIEADKNSEKELELLIGASGTQFFKGFYNISDTNEYVVDLKGQKAIQTYNRMRKSDPQVKLALLSLTHPIVDAYWTIEPAGDPAKGDNPSPQEVEAAELINEWWFNGDFKWESTLRQVLSFFWAGFSVFEKVYVYDGKYIKLKKLAQRLPDTIVEWKVENEELIAIKQYIAAGETARQVWIPSEKVVMFVFDQEGEDYRGQSALRAAYKPWYYKDTIQRIQAMQIERWSLGIPKITQTDAVIGNSSKNKAIEMVQNLRAHEKGYAYVPKGFELDLLDSGSAKMIDPQPAINYHDASILKCIMAQFLELGQTETGARSLGETLKDMCLMGLSFSADYVAEVMNHGPIKELTFFNFGAGVRPPVLKCSGIQSVDFELLSRAYASLTTSGAIEMDDPTEAHIRNQLGLPAKDVDTARAKPQPQIPNQNTPAKKEPEEKEDPKKAVGKGGKKLSASVETASVGYEAGTYLYFWRQLRPNEECIALREIVGRIDDTKERLVKATRSAREKVVAELIAQAEAAVAAKNATAAQKMDYSEDVRKELINDVLPLLKETIEYGYEQVVKELGRQRIKFASMPDLSDAEMAVIMKRYFKAQSDQFSEKVLDILVDRFRIASMNAIRTGGWDISAIRNDVESISENTVRRFGGGILNDAFAAGRNEAAQEMKKDIAYVEYSAILDGSQCYACQDLDGKQFEFDSAEYLENSPPLPSCESTASGYNLCRCIWVYVGKEESAPQA